MLSSGSASAAPVAPATRGDARLDRARAIARMLDGAVRIPGTGVRVGLDPVLGLVPGLGDVAGAALSGYVVLLAARLGAPRAVLLRMLLNVATDTALGAVPVLGDAFDVVWRSNTRNVALLEAALDRPRETREASGVMVALVLVALVLLAAVGIALAVVVVRAILHAVR